MTCHLVTIILTLLLNTTIATLLSVQHTHHIQDEGRTILERSLVAQGVASKGVRHDIHPTHARTGAKVLRQRLQGPSMLTYYPPTSTSSQ